MFSAAAEGCLMCVRYYVEGVGLPHAATSETSKYTALDFAQWASAQDGTDTQAVQRYLTSFARTGARDAVGVHSAQGLVPVVFQTSLAERGAQQRDGSGQQMAAGGWMTVDYVTPPQRESNVVENHGDTGRAWPRSPSRSPPRQPASPHACYRHSPGKASGKELFAPYRRLDPTRAFRHVPLFAYRGGGKYSEKGFTAPTSPARPTSQRSAFQMARYMGK